MKINCPQCESENVIRCELAHARGTTTGKISGSLLGADVYSDGSFSPAIGGGAVGTNSQTMLAQMCAPPQKPTEYGILPFLTFVLICITLLVATEVLIPTNLNSIIHYALLALCPLAAFGAAFGVKTLSKSDEKQKTYRQALFSWQRSWVCLKCGRIFTVKSGEQMPSQF